MSSLHSAGLVLLGGLIVNVVYASVVLAWRHLRRRGCPASHASKGHCRRSAGHEGDHIAVGGRWNGEWMRAW